MGFEANHTFAVLLRRHRLLAGLSQEALAERAGLSVRGISDLERGVRRAPHPATIARLADALQLDMAGRATLLSAAMATPAVEAEEPRPAAVEPPPAPPVASKPTEERRWVTVLAVQLRGFGDLAERLDPEDLHALTDHCTARITEEVRRFDGTVLRSTGESILAVFGAPVAHEDDAERALRAGLAIRDCRLTLPGGDPGSRLEVGVGVHTGEVLAGFHGDAAQRQYSVSGAPVSVAVGLANSTHGSTVLVAEQTYRGTYHHVRYRAIPPVQTRDWNRPLAAWEAIQVDVDPAARALRHAPFIGRDHELDVLLGALARVLREERPHLVSVLGEAGIGKSRLIAEFERRAVASSRIKVLRGRCLPYGEVVGYGALAMALDELAGIAPDDPATEARARLGQLVSHTLHAPDGHDPDVSEVERHLALLSGLDTEADRLGAPSDARSMHVSVRRFLEAAARAEPICLLIEDLHWADEALLNLLEHVAERALAAPLLIVTQARADLLEKRPTWGGGVRAFTSLPLQPLDAEAGLALADALCQERGLSADNAAQVNRMAGGNPLFAEELCAAMAEGSEAGGVPSALRALISARLDALPPQEKHALQHAAVLGKPVCESGLAALDVGGDILEQLETLERRDLLRALPTSRFRGRREYAFKHDLIREMAYGLLPRAERRRLHARVVEWLEQTSGERIEENLDLLAHHAVNAELDERALDYLSRAAERATRAAAHREAAALLQQALALAERAGRIDLIAELHARRGRALTRLTLWVDARQELLAALEGLRAEQGELRAEVLVDLAKASNWALDADGLRVNATEGLQAAEAVGRTDLVMDARFWLAWWTGADGEVTSAIEQYRQTVADTQRLGVSPAPSVLPLYSTALCWAGQFRLAVDRGRDAVRVAREAGDTDSTILAQQVLGLALAGTGAYDEAALVFDEAARFGRDYGVDRFLARALAMSAGFHLDVFDYEGHTAIAEEACALARSVDFLPALTSAGIDLMLNLARRGEVGRAAVLEREVATAVERASMWHGWLWQVRFSEARAEGALARGDFDAAASLASSAIGFSRGRRPKYEALGLITRASASLGRGALTDAIDDLRTAVAIARSVGDPALFLRAASAMLAVDGDDALLAETRAVAAAMLARLPDVTMRQRFLAAEAVRRLGSFAEAATANRAADAD